MGVVKGSELIRERDTRSQVMHRLSKALRGARVESGLSQKALAARVGIRPAYLSQIETGGRFPSFGLLTKLASALDTQVFQLMLAAELPKEGKRGSLLYLLAKVIEQAPDVGKLLGSLGLFVALEASQTLARARATMGEAERIATAAAVAKVGSRDKKRIDAGTMRQIVKEAFAEAEVVLKTM